MRKRVTAKGNLRQNDVMRAVVTDTLPEEVPIVFSNDGFYKNTSGGMKLSGDEAELAETILSQKDGYTIPYRYNVLRDNSSTRGLSLIHPAAQARVAEFYYKYDALICHYARRSTISLRSPFKVGSTYFVRGPGSSKNSVKRHSIDTVAMEKTVSSPASYFSYNHVDRAHKFFGSDDYLHLEKKFSIFRMLDVAKCFSSIYTHTITWAVSDVRTAKDNTFASSFGNDFDRLMQSMNYNETNGICIGPEVSRVFAEIILSAVDEGIKNRLITHSLEYRKDYDIRRYVDDFYVFGRDEDVVDTVTGSIEAELREYNLHINSLKTVTLKRPFSTPRSEIVSMVNSKLNTFFGRFLGNVSVSNDIYAYPLRIYKSNALIRSFVNDVKASCLMHDAGYEAAADYILSALWKRVRDLVEGFEFGRLKGADADDYIAAILVLLETSYFFYTVNPTVRSSLNLARSIVSAGKFARSRVPDRMAFLSEAIVRWTLDLIKSIRADAKHKKLTAVPIEVLNIIIPMREIAANEPLIDALVGEMCEAVDTFEYFEIITFLYIIGDSPKHRILRHKLFLRAKAIVAGSKDGPRINAEAAHLALDLLSCPYLPVDKRGGWFNTLRSRSRLPKVSRVAAQEAVTRMQDFPWFVQWTGIELENILRKKELSAVY